MGGGGLREERFALHVEFAVEDLKAGRCARLLGHQLFPLVIQPNIAAITRFALEHKSWLCVRRCCGHRSTDSDAVHRRTVLRSAYPHYCTILLSMI